ncbi:hypothetical protein M9458_019504, partial [Cirrhinus mrigala]
TLCLEPTMIDEPSLHGATDLVKLPPLLPTSLEPSVTPVPTFSPERALVSTSGLKGAPVPVLSPERAPVSKPNP